MKYEVWSERLIPKISIFLMTTRLRKKRFQTSSNPKKQHIAILQKKKNLTVLKKQQHMAGWGVSKRNIVITFEHSLYRLEEKGNFLGENVKGPESISF